jgi:RimJ/RimL family protein N-acetyltransferase
MIVLSEINKADLTQLALLMSWRSNPLIFSNFLNQVSPLEWSDHYNFINASKDRIDYLVYMKDRPIGHVAVSNIRGEFPEISIMIGETTLWGKGISKYILEIFINLLVNKGFYKFSSRISNNNLSSIRLFLGRGFRKVSKLDGFPNWSLYVLEISDQARRNS